MARMVDADALAKAMGVYTYMKTEWTPTSAWGVPIVDAEPVRHEHWEEHKDYPGLAYLCSGCGYFTTDRSYYCPRCGAKMDEAEE